MYTHETGAHAIEYCQVIDECELNQPCGPGSTCVDLTHGYRCDCAPGYAGEHCEVDIDECSNNDACLNGGRCEDLVAGYRCECPTGYAGANCQINVDDCIDAYCRFGATCIDGLNSYTCQCQDGFAGEHCEINLYDCASDPCQNGASCIDLQADFSCCCLPGYTGRFCEEIKDYCASAPCYGGANCTSTITNYECACPPGFTGRDCDVDIDECSAVSCENGGTCKDLINGFQCACPLGFIGEQCEQVLSSDFDLPFPSARTTDRAELEGVLPDLFEFTLSFWMTTSDQENYGTPVSYAVRGQNDEEDMDNALTLQDYNNLVLFVNGEAAFTYVQANRDSNWRFITVTWTSETGAWAIYVDGRRENSGSDLSRGNLIRGRGMFVVGQEQDSYAGSYVSRESFIGTITQVNVWDYAMNPDEILDVHASCTHSGNAISWSQLSTGIRGQITARTPSAQCGAIDMCEASYCMNGGVCVENQSGRFCVCSQGWYGPRCETEAVPCALGIQCLNGGSCMGQNGVCACPIGVEGRNCEDVVGCDSLQCQNGNICSISMGKPVCACSSGFTGRRCQFDVNECSSDNGGCDHICQNSFGSFSCSCNRGYVLQEDGKTCNDISFCEYKGTFYARGYTWEDGCDECICQNGRAQCSPRTCPVLNCNADETEIWLPGACCPTCLPETKTCSLDTAGNHTTFDGYRFESMGKCRYVLTQDCGGTANFEVHVQHEPTSGKTPMNLTLYIYVDCVEITISPNGTVNVFNETLALPYVHDSPQNVRIENIGEDDILVTTNKGLFVEWSSTEVRVRLSTQYRSTACGLCGNMNGQEADDGLTREFIKSKRKQILLHGWRVDGNKYCKKREAKSETGIRFGKIEAEWCSDYDQLTEARGKCKIFKKNKFKACYKYVDPTPYYKLCLEDTCTCGVTESCYCEPISAYVNECQRNGVAIKSWKRQTSCYITCYHSEVYDDCGPPCRATCEDPEGQSCTPSPVVCKAGCQCKAGRVLHDGQCIRIDDCPS
ncbi:uncharacterized protein [Diadema antillarum]|uniref:uncharacterized protein n=1 Tax=Diadema antillarum TaxID=105358 RepID=UPI003A8AD3D7